MCFHVGVSWFWRWGCFVSVCEWPIVDSFIVNTQSFWMVSSFSAFICIKSHQFSAKLSSLRFWNDFLALKGAPERSSMVMEVVQGVCQESSTNGQTRGEFMWMWHIWLDKTALDGVCFHCFDESCVWKCLYFLTATSSPKVDFWWCRDLAEWFCGW